MSVKKMPTLKTMFTYVTNANLNINQTACNLYLMLMNPILTNQQTSSFFKRKAQILAYEHESQ